MRYDEVIQATLLLSCYFNKNEVREVKPLTPTEYARFAAWLHKAGLTPADLLHKQTEVMSQWQDPKNKITAERIKFLLARGASMGFALEHWAKHGIWLVSRASKQYPKKIREKIGDIRPPILFGIGNKELLNKPGIGFVGSRSISPDDESFTASKAELAVSQGFVVVSGGAKGVDQVSMTAALSYGGESVGILSDSLLKASASKAYREGLRNNKLVLLSPFYPEAGFSVGNAMARNKYIYAMSDAVVVVKSDHEKGGTWAGAIENLKKQWVPLLVRDIKHQGNQAIIAQGGLPMSDDFADYTAQPTANTQPKTDESPTTATKSGPAPIAGDAVSAGGTDDLFADQASEDKPTEPQASKPVSPPEPSETADKTILEPASHSGTAISNSEEPQAKDTPTILSQYGEIFTLFYKKIEAICVQEQSVTPARLYETYPELTEALIKKWLKLLEEEGYVAKKGRKLVYTLTDKSQVNFW